MKRTLLFVMILCIAACTKPQPTVILQPNPIIGEWVMKSDTSVYCYVESIKDDTAMVMFTRRIADPNKEPIYIQYHFYTSDNKMHLQSLNLYPSMYFWYDGYVLKGMMAEYRNIEGQGSYKEIVKVK